MSKDWMSARQYLEQNHPEWLKGKTEAEIQAKIDEMTAKANKLVARMPAGALHSETKQ